MKKVLILLSTYNGEKYLREQLDSIVRQKDVEVTVLVRDDGSNDGTLKILEGYRQHYPSMFLIEQGENVGCRLSFFWLIKKAADDYTDFDYYAFADQDDVWLEDKMISGVIALDQVDNDYKIYYCNYQMVDENLNKIRTRLPKNLGTLEEAFILQPCIGCSMILSKKLIQQASLPNFSECDIHDTWTYRLNLALGGSVIQDNIAHLNYRQHGSNVVGSNQSFLKKWNRRIKSFKKKSTIKSKQAREIVRCYSEIIPKDRLYFLTLIGNYKDSIRKKMTILFSKKIKSRRVVHNYLFKLAILTNRI